MQALLQCRFVKPGAVQTGPLYNQTLGISSGGTELIRQELRFSDLPAARSVHTSFTRAKPS